MKKYFTLIFILFSIPGFSQDSIKIYQRITPYIKIWPDANSLIGKWHVEEYNGILITFPSIESDKRVKILKYNIVEKNGNAIIKRDPTLKMYFGFIL